MGNLFKILWLVACVGVAIWGIQMGGEANIVAVYLLGALTIPSGVAVYVIGSLLLSLFTKSDPNFGVTHDVAISIVMYSMTILVGYWQWFILLPKGIRKFKNRKASRQN